MIGVVVKSTGSSYLVALEGGGEVECVVRGRWRLRRSRSTNPVAVGDRVEVEQGSIDTATGMRRGVIVGVEPRRNCIVRRAANLSRQSHVLAANVDLALLVVTVDWPRTSTTFIDRFLAGAEAYGVPAALAINKIDLYNDRAREAKVAEWRALYGGLDYEVLLVSAETGAGVGELEALLRDRQTLLAGHSGVGKSALTNCLLGREVARTAPISVAHEAGRHTTTFSQMYRLPGGGGIIDIPGVKGFGTVEFRAAEVGHYFREIFRIGRGCRYSDCTHRNEPGCRVVEAVERGEIAASRYRSYLSILGDEGEDRYREAY